MTKDNPYWEEGTDLDGRVFNRRIDDGYTEYKLDVIIANRIKELRLGLNGNKQHSYRALAIQVNGVECQMTGQDLCRLAEWTLNEEWND